MKHTITALQESATSSARLASKLVSKSGVIISLGCTTIANAHLELLPDTTIIANRSETSLDEVGSSVSLLYVEELEKEGFLYLDDVLKFTPGTISESTGGQRGSISSLFLRGTATNHTHIRVDGFRISGPNVSAGGFLGGSGLAGLSRIEILRGPQSALYGGDAIGGVLGIYSEKGSGTPGGSFSIGGGSFGSFSSALTLDGEIDRLSYAFGIGYQETDNDLPNNQFDQLNYHLRVDYEINDALNVGLTVRGFESDFRRPNYSDPNFSRAGDDVTESLLTTIFAEYKVNDQWTSKLTLGLYDENLDSQTFNSPNFFQSDAQKYAAYWDNTVKWNSNHTTTTGLVYEKTDFDYASEFFGLTEDSRSSDQYGIYINHNWNVTDSLTVTGGVRWEDYDTFGDEVTWRGAVAYYFDQTHTKLRASVGKGFRPPSFIEIFGFGGTSNFNLGPEESIGWDVGIDQEFCDGQYQLGLTFFENKIEDSIETVFLPPTFAGSTFNADGTSTTRGIEFEARASWLDDRVRASLAYTWLDESLSGQPEHSGGLRFSADVTEKWVAGFSINYLDSRTFGGNELDSYTLVNLHTSYDITPNITLTAKIENLFDTDYEFASFGSGVSESIFPGRGRGVFAGLTYTW